MGLKTNFETNDSKLVLYVRDGNEDAKDHLFQKYSPLIHKEINRLKKKAFIYGIEFSDLTQEAMVGFSFAINSYDEEGDVKFITFATTCIRRRLKNYIEKFETVKNKSYSKSISLDTNINERNTILDQLEEFISSEPLRKIINDETLVEVSGSIMKKLSENERLVLQYTVDGKSVKEIADIMSMSNKQIYNLIHRARNKIKVGACE